MTRYSIENRDTISRFLKAIYEDRFSDKAMLQSPCQRFDAITTSALNTETSPPLAEKMEAMVNQTWLMINPIESRSFLL